MNHTLLDKSINNKKLAIKEQSTMSPINGAYVSGLILGWAARLERNPESVKNVINDMNEFSKLLAVRSGVTLFEDIR